MKYFKAVIFRLTKRIKDCTQCLLSWGRRGSIFKHGRQSARKRNQNIVEQIPQIKTKTYTKKTTTSITLLTDK